MGFINKYRYFFWILPFFIVLLGQLCTSTEESLEDTASSQKPDIKCWNITKDQTPEFDRETELIKVPSGAMCSISYDSETGIYDQTIDMEQTSETCHSQGTKFYCRCSVNECNELYSDVCHPCLSEAMDLWYSRFSSYTSPAPVYSDLKCYYMPYDRYDYDSHAETKVIRAREGEVCSLEYHRKNKVFVPDTTFSDEILSPNEYKCVEGIYGIQCICNEENCNTKNNPKCQKCLEWVNESITYVMFPKRKKSELWCIAANDHYKEDENQPASERAPDETVCAIFYINNEPYQTFVNNVLAQPGYQCISLFGFTTACVCDEEDCNTINNPKCTKCFDK